jgi:hypothetical protein
VVFVRWAAGSAGGFSPQIFGYNFPELIACNRPDDESTVRGSNSLLQLPGVPSRNAILFQITHLAAQPGALL